MPWTLDPGKVITAAMKAAAVNAATMAAYENAIQDFVDAKARDRLFRDGVTLASYAASTNPLWAAQALAFIAWRDQVWAYAYGELDKVLGGARTAPDIIDFLAELPAIVWPAGDQ